MKKLWYAMAAPMRAESGEITAKAAVPGDSPWFAGHFPDAPVLPAVAQLNLLVQMLAQATGRPLCLRQASRFKFRQQVLPGAELELSARPDGADRYICHITENGQEVSGGTLVLADKQQDGNMSEQSPTTRRVAEIVINELKLEDVTPDSFDPDLDLVDEVGIDSMDLATIALVIRDEFGIRIDEDDYPKLTTLRIIADYIDQKRAGA